MMRAPDHYDENMKMIIMLDDQKKLDAHAMQIDESKRLHECLTIKSKKARIEKMYHCSHH